MSSLLLVVTAVHPSAVLAAQQWAEQYGIPYLPHATMPVWPSYDYALVFANDAIGVQMLKAPRAKPFYLQFDTGTLAYRARMANKQNELLAKAMGFKSFKSRSSLHVLDVTAGFGRDAFILAILGAEVTMLERSPIISLLLQDALKRLRGQQAFERLSLQLIETNAIQWLKEMNALHRPDVVYLDPMFPERKKSAAIKKEMVILRDLVGDDHDAVTLFEAAIACPVARVVVKRPIHGKTLGSVSPHFSVYGRANRFDVYIRCDKTC